MISFDSGPHRFDLRAVAILINGDRILLHRRDRDPFRALPGGRVEAGETAESAAVRKRREESAEKIDCDRLVFVDVRPSFLVDALGHEPLAFRLVVHRDGQPEPPIE